MEVLAMKIFLDDFRDIPAGSTGFNVAKNYEQCEMMLEIFGNDLEFIDLDYDLGGHKTGLDILIFMKSNNIMPKHINIHSDHPEGAPAMRHFAEENFPDSLITMTAIHDHHV